MPTTGPALNPASHRANTAPKRALHIALVGYRSHPHVGGQGIYITHLATALQGLGHDVSVISGPPYPQLPADIPLIKLPSLDLYEVPNHVTALRLKHLRSFADVYEWWSMLTGGFAEPYCFGRRLKRYLKEHPGAFDVVHDNQSLCSALLTLNMPTLATVHHPISRDRDCAVANAKNWLHRWGARRWYSFVTMQKRVTQRLTHVVTVSEASRRDIASCFGRPEHNTRVIFNGINTDTFKPLPNRQKHSEQLLATCSSDQPVKGFKFLLQAYATLIKARPNLQLTVIGQLKPNGESRALLHSLNLESRVLFRHGLSETEMVEAYNRATLFVCPSLYEGFGLPAAEAMSCATAVVSSDGGALPEVIANAGTLVPAGDASALADAIAQLLDDTEQRAHYERLGRERALTTLSWPAVAQQYIALYQQAINTHHNARAKASTTALSVVPQANNASEPN
ncbi:MAG TPA: glycosyltransferase family 4 protein [Marinagarivorans sp.]